MIGKLIAYKNRKEVTLTDEEFSVNIRSLKDNVVASESTIDNTGLLAKLAALKTKNQN